MIINQFNPEWKLWIWSNIVNGLPSEDVFNVLLNHGFSYELVARELNIDPVNPLIWQRQYSQNRLNEEANGTSTIFPLKRDLIDNPNVYFVENNLLEIYRVPTFFTNEELSTINSNLESLTDPKSELYLNISSRIDNFLGIDGDNGLPIDLIHQTPETVYDEFISPVTNTTWTVVISLNNSLEGGEINFPDAEISVKPSQGEAILWMNKFSDGTHNPNGKHIYATVEQDERYVITKTYLTKKKTKRPKPQQINLNS